MIKILSSIVSISAISIIGWFASFQSHQFDPMNYPSYEEQWKLVYEQDVQGKPKSATELVEKIYQQAKKEDNAPQVYKTLMFLSRYTMLLEENAELTIVNRMKEEIATAKTPTKELLQSSLAELYWQYYNRNRYKFLNRTATEGGIDETDFRTWDLQKLFDETSSYYDQSLSNAKSLQDFQLADFKDILAGNTEDYPELRPSLYDFLAHRAIDFYSNDQSGLTKPANQFELKDEAIFGDVKSFLKYKPNTEEKSSNRLKTIQLYQDLITFHEKGNNDVPLLQVNLERLQYVYSQARIDNKDELYKSALKTILNDFKKQDGAAMAGYLLANLYRSKGYQYNADNEETFENQWKFKEAIEIAEEMVAQYPESLGAQNAQNLISDIKRPSLNITAVKNIVPNQPFRLKVDYKNIDQLHYSIVEMNEKQLSQMNGLYNEGLVAFLSKLKPMTTWSNATQSVGDYQSHSYEEIANNKQGLPAGQYLIIATPDSQLTSKTTSFGYTVIQSTNIAYTSKKSEDKGYDFYVVHRETGKPIPYASINFNNDDRRGGGNKINRTVKADKNGFVNVNLPEDYYYNLNIKISSDQFVEEAQFNNFYYRDYNNRRKPEWTTSGFIFTDRSIYRPGQTVYFKTIALKTNGTESELLQSEKLEVELLDANGEEIEKIQLQTNEFGSAQGNFVIPRGRLLGNYRLNVATEKYKRVTSTSLSVEEYKRPKFEVEMLDLEGNYKLGDEITAKGNAKAYAGSNISEAKVSYRVTRKVRFPYYFYSFRRPSPMGDNMEITFGETITDAQGDFEIPFTAIADESISAESLPVFTYEINVDVTDINGETRSDNSSVKVGYTAMDLTISANDFMDVSGENKITIFTKNLNAQPIAGKGNVRIFKLNAPKNVLVSRSFSAPDQQIISEAEWRKLFPHEPYTNDEGNVNNWTNGKEVFSSKFSTDEEDGKEEFDLKAKKWEPGYYSVEVDAKDAFGKEISQQKRIFIADKKSKQVADKELFNISLDKSTYEPGEIATLSIGSAANELSVLVEVFRDQTKMISEQLKLSNEIKTITIPIEEKDRGGLVAVYTFTKWNRTQSGQERITVPWTNKQLNIEVETFRDKLQPGSEETWTFTVKGSEGEKVSAEFLASMYDASLDQFKGHSWQANVSRRSQYSINGFSSNAFGNSNFSFRDLTNYPYMSVENYQFPSLEFFGMNLGYVRNNSNYVQRVQRSAAVEGGVFDVGQIELESSNDALEEVVVVGYGVQKKEMSIGAVQNLEGDAAGLYVVDGVIVDSIDDLDPSQIGSLSVLKGADATALYGSKGANGVIVVSTGSGAKEAPLQVKARKNLEETAFFFPQLKTDQDGHVQFTFTTPESLTKWRMMAFAHTQDLSTGTWEGSTITQKELMVIPNAPRFFRIGDELTFSTKIANLSKKQLNGKAELQLLDAITLEPIYSQFSPTTAIQDFTVGEGGNTSIDWTLTIPDDVPAVTYRVLAKAGNFSDGEESSLPILSNRMLVTESLPIPLRSNQTKSFRLNKLIKNESTTLKNHRLTLEMTSNPAWYAVQSLPYLMEFPYECSEQTFSRYYANSLATHIANSDPKIKRVFDAWKNTQPDALKSNLEKNEELKSLILRETPWVRDAQNEAEQKRRVGLLFDLNKMADEQAIAINQLQQLQSSNGGWPWFAGGRDNRYISQHIVGGLGHLDQLNVSDVREDDDTWRMTKKAINYLDDELMDDLKNLKRYNKDWKDIKSISYTQVHYFYVRSFFTDVEVSKKNKEAFDFYFGIMKKDWLSDRIYENGLKALAFNRYNEQALAQKLVTSLRETSITNEELGMYWKSNTASWYWYQAPIETQALMIEVFDEIANDQAAVDELKVWLLKNKQTNSWETTKSTAEAVYALLLRGGEWLSVDDLVELKLGDEIIDPKNIDGVNIEAGTGYFKTAWNGTEITPKMGQVTATKKGDGIAFGALYWQYFEDLDKITSAETPLKLEKQLFLQKNTASGPKLSPVADGQQLQIGDLLKVRIELRVDRDMEFVHMKDMRAAGFEPTNVLSTYKWQDGLGYYESTKDASTDFFFDDLPKGVYVFEYPLRVSQNGDFSNGITTIQSMYAPEFTSHSEGVRVSVGQ